MESQEQALRVFLGEEDAKKVLKLQTNCDKYLKKFKKEMNELLKPHNHEVLCGVAYRKVEEKKSK